MCYPPSIKTELKNFTINNDSVNSDLYTMVSPTFKKFNKTGNMEKLYSNMYSEIVIKAPMYFEGLSRDASTLVLTKLVDKLIAQRKKLNNKNAANSIIETPFVLSQNERHGLIYIGGYVFKKLYKKIKNSSTWNTKNSQMAISFLLAGRCNENDSAESYFDKINRGGLWKISPPAEDILTVVETYFRTYTSSAGIKNIDIEQILKEALANSTIITSCETLLNSSEAEIDSDVAKDTLFSIISLYIRVRSYSKAKQLLEEYKKKNNLLQNLKACEKVSSSGALNKTKIWVRN